MHQPLDESPRSRVVNGQGDPVEEEPLCRRAVDTGVGAEDAPGAQISSKCDLAVVEVFAGLSERKGHKVEAIFQLSQPVLIPQIAFFEFGRCGAGRQDMPIEMAAKGAEVVLVPILDR